ncbi:hypothetical protein CGRA01v4_02366 [Colletotrichum graminicola]|nr:hypothetical protein CGRA01v4_02366 [Colletotrichum graminicola]
MGTRTKGRCDLIHLAVMNMSYRLCLQFRTFLNGL